MGKFRQFFMELSARPTSVFSFPDDNLSKYHSAFTKLGMYMNSMEVWAQLFKTNDIVS